MSWLLTVANDSLARSALVTATERATTTFRLIVWHKVDEQCCDRVRITLLPVGTYLARSTDSSGVAYMSTMANAACMSLCPFSKLNSLAAWRRAA